MEKRKNSMKLKDLISGRSLRTYEYSLYLSKLHKIKEKKINSFIRNDSEDDKILKEYFQNMLNRKDSLFEIVYK
jgi:hypothetical protein